MTKARADPGIDARSCPVIVSNSVLTRKRPACYTPASMLGFGSGGRMDNGVSRTLLAAMLVLLGTLPAHATPGAGPAPPSPPPIAVPLANPGIPVLNGGFETGTYAPQWTLAPGGPFDYVCKAGTTIGAATCVVHSGQYAMSLGLAGGTDSLSQNIPTVAGKSYLLSFFLANANPLDQNITTFQVFWDGVSVYSLPSPQPTFPYRQVILNVTATTASTPLAFVAQ